MTEPDTPANPLPERFTSIGLTKREYMATLIMAGLSADPELTSSGATVARIAVERADALIAALNAPPKRLDSPAQE